MYSYFEFRTCRTHSTATEDRISYLLERERLITVVMWRSPLLDDENNNNAHQSNLIFITYVLKSKVDMKLFNVNNRGPPEVNATVSFALMGYGLCERNGRWRIRACATLPHEDFEMIQRSFYGERLLLSTSFALRHDIL